MRPHHAALTMLLAAAAPTLAGEPLYAWETTFERLVLIDPAVPSATTVSPGNSTGVLIAEIELTGDLMVGAGNSEGGRLFFIDPGTGVITGNLPLVFPPEGNAVTAMEFIGGRLYAGLTTRGGGTDSFLATIDPETGEVTPVGGPTGAGSPLGGLAFDGTDLYAVTAGGDAPLLYTIDRETGAGTRVAPVVATGVFNLTLTALEFAADGTLYSLANVFASHGLEGHLLTIDPATGLVTDLGDTGNPSLVALTSAFVAPGACTDADLAPPLGTLDLADVVAFVHGFTGLDPATDFDGNGVWDLADIVAFVESFNTGCP